MEANYYCRVALIGRSYVGKSGLSYRLEHSSFEDQVCKGGDYFQRVVQLDGKVAKVFVFDWPGIERFSGFISQVCHRAQGIFLVYDITDRSSFEGAEYWLSIPRKHSDADVVIMLIGNKLDQEPRREVTTEEGRRFADQNNLLFMETSALDSTNVEAALTQLVTEIERREKLKPFPSDANPSDQTGSSSGGNSCSIF